MGLVSSLKSLLRVIDRLVPKELYLETGCQWDQRQALGFGERGSVAPKRFTL